MSVDVEVVGAGVGESDLGVGLGGVVWEGEVGGGAK